MARLFHQRVQQVITPLQHSGGALVVSGEHVDHLDKRLQRPRIAESLCFHLLFIVHTCTTQGLWGVPAFSDGAASNGEVISSIDIGEVRYESKVKNRW